MGHSSYFGYSLVHQVIVMISHQFSSEREHGGDTMSDLNYATLNATVDQLIVVLASKNITSYIPFCIRVLLS
jgi:hypothetical protein